MKIHVLAHSLKSTAQRNGITLLELPRFVSGYGFEGLEISDRQLAGHDEEWLMQFSKECRSHHCDLIIDINVDFTTADSKLRVEEIDHARKIIGIAVILEAHRMRICIGGQRFTVQTFFRKKRAAPQPGKEEVSGKALFEKWIMLFGHIVRRSMSPRISDLEGKVERAVDSLHQIMPAAAEHGIRIGIENHWGLSGDPHNIIRIINAVNSPNLGTCSDMGNFPRGVDPLTSLNLLAPYAVILHAKSYSFRKDGEEKSIDYRQCLSIFRQSGFNGPITVEYEGLTDDLRGCLLTRDLILCHWTGTGIHKFVNL